MTAPVWHGERPQGVTQGTWGRGEWHGEQPWYRVARNACQPCGTGRGPPPACGLGCVGQSAGDGVGSAHWLSVCGVGSGPSMWRRACREEWHTAAWGSARPQGVVWAAASGCMERVVHGCSAGSGQGREGTCWLWPHRMEHDSVVWHRVCGVVTREGEWTGRCALPHGYVLPHSCILEWLPTCAPPTPCVAPCCHAPCPHTSQLQPPNTSCKGGCGLQGGGVCAGSAATVLQLVGSTHAVMHHAPSTMQPVWPQLAGTPCAGRRGFWTCRGGGPCGVAPYSVVMCCSWQALPVPAPHTTPYGCLAAPRGCSRWALCAALPQGATQAHPTLRPCAAVAGTACAPCIHSPCGSLQPHTMPPLHATCHTYPCSCKPHPHPA